MDKIVIKTNKKSIEMEVVLTFKINGKDFVIYKDEENNHFIAKYNFRNDKLDTNLTDEELLFGEKVLNEVLNETNSK